MKPAINTERLADHFSRLCEISSPSREERQVAEYLKETFSALGADFVFEDTSQSETGSDSGNLVFRFDSTSTASPLFFACHMDTVMPGHGVEVVRTGDIFTSRGETILGGDDKSGVAALIELISVLKESGIKHRTLELVFTTCEEVGLLGAKAFDIGQLRSTFGYALDSTGIDKVIIGAPAANKVRIDVHGTAAHAGISPENGVSAFLIAAQAITKLKLGRIDEESTANIGIMEGGVATNIIPDHLMLRGEIRSHSTEKLHLLTDEMKATFMAAAADWPLPENIQANKPSIGFKVESDYPAMRLSENDEVLRTIKNAARSLGRNNEFIIAGGGSDANIFNGKGLSTAIVATGMNKVHTTEECLDLKDMARLTELLLAIACGD